MDMESTVVGLFGIAVGLVVTFAGYGAFRLVLTIAGAYLGFSVGVWGVLSTGGNSGVWTFIAMLAGVALAVLFGWLAFSFFRVAVFVGLGCLGFVLGLGLMSMIGVTEPWVLWAVGVLVAVGLVVAGLVGDIATILVVILTALSGAELVITGVMLLTGDLGMESLTTGSLSTDHSWLWLLGWAALAVAGIVVQQRAIGGRDVRMQQEWARSRSEPQA